MLITLLFYFPSRSATNNGPVTIGYYVALAICTVVILILAYCRWRTSKETDLRKARTKFIEATKKMKMNKYELKNKLTHVLESKGVFYQDAPDYEYNLSIYIGKTKTLVSLEYLYSKCSDEEVVGQFEKFLIKNQYFNS